MLAPLVRSSFPGHGWRLGEHDNLPGGLVVLHVPVGGDDLVEAEDAVDVGPVDARLTWLMFA